MSTSKHELQQVIERLEAIERQLERINAALPGIALTLASIMRGVTNRNAT